MLALLWPLTLLWVDPAPAMRGAARLSAPDPLALALRRPHTLPGHPDRHLRFVDVRRGSNQGDHHPLLRAPPPNPCARLLFTASTLFALVTGLVTHVSLRPSRSRVLQVWVLAPVTGRRRLPLPARRPAKHKWTPVPSPAPLPNNVQNPESPVAKDAVSLCHTCGVVLDEDLLCYGCDYAPGYRSAPSAPTGPPAAVDDPAVFDGPGVECFQCHFAYAPDRGQCPKCEYGRYEQNASRYLTVDIAHRNQTVPQAVDQFKRSLQLATDQQYAGILYVTGQGKIAREIQGLLHFLWGKGRLLSYAPMENNPGSWLAQINYDLSLLPADGGFTAEFWARDPHRTSR